MCGVGLEPEFLRRLLPPGDEFEARFEPMEESAEDGWCNVSVDDVVIVAMALYPSSYTTDPMEFAREGAEPVEIAGYDAVQWPDGIMTYAPCFAESTDGRGSHIGLNMQVGEGLSAIEDDGERAEAIRAFAGEFIEGLKESQGCEV